jgi:hypothetical protein
VSARTVPEGYPDLQKFLLPSRAYLLSFRDQTLPARRAALADARSYFEQFEAEDHEAQLGLLGLIGESLQVVEDVGVLANAFMTGIPGLSFYVKATAYDANNVNNFYSQAHKRDDDYYLRLAALRFGGKSIHELFRFSPPLEDADLQAIAAAEHATGTLLRDQMIWLAGAWEAHRQIFHGFKHGALIASAEHVHLLQDHKEVAARVAVWRRRREHPELGSHANLPLRELAGYGLQVGQVALDAADYIAGTRLSTFDRLRFNEQGSVEELTKSSAPPWRFWFRERDIDHGHIQRLEARFGLRFETEPDSLS